MQLTVLNKRGGNECRVIASHDETLRSLKRRVCDRLFEHAVPYGVVLASSNGKCLLLNEDCPIKDCNLADNDRLCLIQHASPEDKKRALSILEQVKAAEEGTSAPSPLQATLLEKALACDPHCAALFCFMGTRYADGAVVSGVHMTQEMLLERALAADAGDVDALHAMLSIVPVGGVVKIGGVLSSRKELCLRALHTAEVAELVHALYRQLAQEMACDETVVVCGKVYTREDLLAKAGSSLDKRVVKWLRTLQAP